MLDDILNVAETDTNPAPYPHSGDVSGCDVSPDGGRVNAPSLCRFGNGHEAIGQRLHVFCVHESPLVAGEEYKKPGRPRERERAGPSQSGH